MGEIKLYNGDCVENMKKIKDGSVHLIITDPPYNLGNFMISRDTNLKKMRENFFASAGWDNLDGSFLCRIGQSYGQRRCHDHFHGCNKSGDNNCISRKAWLLL